MNCALRKIVDTKISHWIFIPIIDNLISAPNKNSAILLLILFWLWPVAYTCSTSANLFMRAAGQLGVNIFLIFLITLIVSRFTKLSGFPKYIVIAIAAHLLADIFARFIPSPVVAISEIIGVINPLMLLQFIR